jgi:hypothetical protein
MSSDLIGGYLKFYLKQPIKWADFRLDALLADTMLTKLYTTGPYCTIAAKEFRPPLQLTTERRTCFFRNSKEEKTKILIRGNR